MLESATITGAVSNCHNWRVLGRRKCQKVPQSQVLYRTVTNRGYLEGVSQAKAMSECVTTKGGGLEVSQLVNSDRRV